MWLINRTNQTNLVLLLGLNFLFNPYLGLGGPMHHNRFEHLYSIAKKNNKVASDILIYLIKYDDGLKKAEYNYVLGLTYFNKTLDPTKLEGRNLLHIYFELALDAFMEFYHDCKAQHYKVRAPKSLIRAAYCAYSLNDIELMSEILDILHKKFEHYRPSQVEENILYQIRPYKTGAAHKNND